MQGCGRRSLRHSCLVLLACLTSLSHPLLAEAVVWFDFHGSRCSCVDGLENAPADPEFIVYERRDLFAARLLLLPGERQYLRWERLDHAVVCRSRPCGGVSEGVTVEAGRCRKVLGTYHGADTSGGHTRCVEYAPVVGALGELAQGSSECSGGSRPFCTVWTYSWDAERCLGRALEAAFGTPVEVGRNYCRCAEGSYFDRQGKDCLEFTTEGTSLGKRPEHWCDPLLLQPPRRDMCPLCPGTPLLDVPRLP